MLLHPHGVLCSGTAVRGAESRQEDHSLPAHGLGHGDRRGHELPPPPQDHPQRPQVTKVSSEDLMGIEGTSGMHKFTSTKTILLIVCAALMIEK